MRRVVTLHTPRTLVTLDPDKTRTALARAELANESQQAPYELAELLGGGASKKPVEHGDVQGALSYLHELLETRTPREVLVIVESQPPDSPWSASVEELRRVRYHWDAACLITGVRIEHIMPVDWESEVVTDSRGAGAIKRGAKCEAEQLLGRKVNQDQADALMMLRWRARRFGRQLIV